MAPRKGKYNRGLTSVITLLAAVTLHLVSMAAKNPEEVRQLHGRFYLVPQHINMPRLVCYTPEASPTDPVNTVLG